MSTSVARTKSRAVPKSIPDGIESAEGKLLYLYLATSGESEVEELVERLNVPRITVFGILGTLADRNVVEQVEAGTYRAV